MFGGDNTVFLSGSPTIQQVIDEIETGLTNHIAQFPQVTLTRNGDVFTLSSTGNLQFVVADLGAAGDVFELGTNDWGTPPVITQVLPADGAGRVFNDDDAAANIGADELVSITIDTNTEENLSQLLIMSPRNGTNVRPVLTSIDGTTGAGAQTTYTVIAPDGSQAGTFTSAVTASNLSDLPTVLGRVEQIIDNFVGWTAADDAADSRIRVTADTRADVTGNWSVAITDAGTIQFTSSELVTGRPNTPGESATITLSHSDEASDIVATFNSRDAGYTAQQVVDGIKAATNATGWTFGGTGTTFSLTNGVNGDIANTWFANTTNDNVSLSSFSETTAGRADIPAETATLTFTHGDGSTDNEALTGPQTAAQIAATLRANIALADWTVSGTDTNVIFTRNTAGAVTGTWAATTTNMDVTVSGAIIDQLGSDIGAEAFADFTIRSPQGDEVSPQIGGGVGGRDAAAIASALAAAVSIPNWNVSSSGDDVLFTSQTRVAVGGLFTVAVTGGNVGVTVTETTPGVTDIPAETATIQIFYPGGTEEMLIFTGPRTTAEIVSELSGLPALENWTNSTQGNAIRYTHNVPGMAIDGTFVGRVTGTNADQLTATGVIVTEAAAASVTGGDYIFSTGRIVDGNFDPADRPDSSYVFEAQRYVYYDSEANEPPVSTNGALYEFRQTIQVGTAGTDGQNGNFSQFRFSTDVTQPDASTYPTDDNANATWSLSSANAIWVISREVTFDGNNVRTNSAWSIQRYRGEDGADGNQGSPGDRTQIRFSDDLVQPQTNTYPTNDEGTNNTWAASSAGAIWVLTREITFDSDGLRTNGAWSITRFRGEDGRAINGDFTQTRFSTSIAQPADTTYPINNQGTNSTWSIASTNAVWALTREVTFDNDNVRTNSVWTISQWLGTTGANGINGQFDQLRFSTAETLPAATTYPTNDVGTNSTWTSDSTNARWVITRTVTFDANNNRTQTAWTASQFRGDDGAQGEDGTPGNFTQVRFSDDALQPTSATYPTNDGGTNGTWAISSSDAVWVTTRPNTCLLYTSPSPRDS